MLLSRRIKHQLGSDKQPEPATLTDDATTKDGTKSEPSNKPQELQRTRTSKLNQADHHTPKSLDSIRAR